MGPTRKPTNICRGNSAPVFLVLKSRILLTIPKIPGPNRIQRRPHRRTNRRLDQTLRIPWIYGTRPFGPRTRGIQQQTTRGRKLHPTTTRSRNRTTRNGPILQILKRIHKTNPRPKTGGFFYDPQKEAKAPKT